MATNGGFTGGHRIAICKEVVMSCLRYYPAIYLEEPESEE